MPITFPLNLNQHKQSGDLDKIHSGSLEPSNLRVVLYSHDTMGLGHIRRNILISQALSMHSLKPQILIITGAKEAGMFALPEKTDCVVLPALYKEEGGKYRSRRLGISLRKIVQLRSSIILSAISSFKPHVVIVDNVPHGACYELDSILEYKKQNKEFKCVLGMRDIKDSAQTVQREWRQQNLNQTIRKYYDQIWIYGDQSVFDVTREYGLPFDIASKIRYTGYLDQRLRLEFAQNQNMGKLSYDRSLLDKPFVLCTVGSGQDGGKLAEIFLQSNLPAGMQGILLTGPHMSKEEQNHLHTLIQGKEDKHILVFVPEPTVLLDKASCVISMGGYNSVIEAISFRKKTLLIPRVTPRVEQLIRAECLARIGVVDMLHPDNLNVKNVSEWIKMNCQSSTKELDHQINLNGLTEIPRLLKNLTQETTG